MTDLIEELLHEFSLPLSNPILIFSLILIIILLSPIILKKFNIPGIIGLIISGVIIGPHGLNILENDSAVDLFSTIGLLYIMFIAGLELDMNEFKSNKNRSILFGFFTFIIPLGVGYPVCYYLLDYDFNASFLTASMFATHTLVTYPIVSKLGIAKNQAVAITVGGTILTDTAVLIILAIILGNSQGGLDSDFFIQLGVSLSIFSFIMFWIIPKIAKWFFKKLESEKHSHYIFVLAIVFFAAFLAEVAGVESIIGAFVAGLALNKLIPHSSALMNRIEFIGNSLFIPFFLISVGMLVDISVILSGFGAIIVAITLSIVAIAGKWLAAFFTKIVFNYSHAQRRLIFGLSSAHAAATLAVIIVGFDAGILDENILNGTIILILMTSIVASFATEKAAKDIVANSEENDNELAENSNDLTNEHILLPIANIESVERLLEFSIFIKDKSSPHPISVVSVVSNDEEAEINLIKARNKLELFVKQGSASETKIQVLTTIDHNPASGISRISKEIMADYIILGWPKKSGIIDKLIGERIDSILTNTDKTTFICQLNNPLVHYKELKVIIPPLAEREAGFELWFVKLCKLAQELSISIRLFSNNITYTAIQKFIKRTKISIKLLNTDFNDWEDILVLSRDINDQDLIVLISARKGSISHMSILDNMPSKLEKHFPNNGKFVIYPQQQNKPFISENYNDVGTYKIGSKIKSVQKLGKNIGDVFKKNKS